MKFKATIIIILVAMLIICTGTAITLIKESKEQTRIALETARLTVIQTYSVSAPEWSDQIWEIQKSIK